MPDLSFAELLIALAAGLAGLTHLLVLQTAAGRTRPLLSITKVSETAGKLDLIVTNIGPVAAVKIVLKVGSVGGNHEYLIDGVAAGGQNTLLSACAVSDWLDVELEYSDSGGHRFLSKRRLERVHQEPFRLVQASEPITERPQLLEPIRGPRSL